MRDALASSNRKTTEYLLIVFFVALYAVVVIRSAWASDDAYITFRVVDNFLSGHGLVWNVGERVQVYTNPLWLFVVTPFFFLSGEVYYTGIILSALVSLATVLLFAFRIARSTIAALLGITILTLAKTFVDYSTSGLENPLIHLILAMFFLVYLRFENSLRALFWLSLIAALGTFNRMDTLLLYLPALAYAFLRLGKWKGVPTVILGFLPFILWECFSLFYYGSPFPNTAYAKLNTGISSVALIDQGLYYLLFSFKSGPVTLLTITAGIAVPVLSKEWRNLPLAAGIVLYVLYVVKIGGGQMSGRFLSAPLFGAVMLISHAPFLSAGFFRPEGMPGAPEGQSFWKRLWAAGPTRNAGATLLAFVAVIAAGFSAPYPSVLTGHDYVGLHAEAGPATRFIEDERGSWYYCTGLLRARRSAEFPDCPWATAGREARAKGVPLAVRRGLGLFGYYAGPEVHVIDPYALADPLLARLTARGDNWRISHFERVIPAGYLDTLVSGENTIRDEGLAAYYDKLALVTRGNLLDRRRLVEIWRLNTGQYHDLVREPASVAEGLVLADWEAPARLTPGEDFEITLYWEGTRHQPFDYNYVSYIYLADEGGDWLGVEAEQVTPLSDANPAGNPVATSTYCLSLPADLPPGEYKFVAGFFPEPFYHDPLPIGEIGPFKVAPPPAAVPADLRPVPAQVGDDIALLGYTASQDGQLIDLDEAAPGPLRLTLYWQALARPDGDFHVFAHVEGPDGALVAGADCIPLDGAYSTTIWDAGEVIATTHDLALPSEDGPFTYYAGMYRWPSLERLPATQEGRRMAEDRVRLWPPRQAG